jgi:hypothetical protein
MTINTDIKLDIRLPSAYYNVLFLIISTCVILWSFRAIKRIMRLARVRAAVLSGRLVHIRALGSALANFDGATQSHIDSIVHTRQAYPPAIVNCIYNPFSITDLLYSSHDDQYIYFQLNITATIPGRVHILPKFSAKLFKENYISFGNYDKTRKSSMFSSPSPTSPSNSIEMSNRNRSNSNCSINGSSSAMLKSLFSDDQCNNEFKNDSEYIPIGTSSVTIKLLRDKVEDLIPANRLALVNSKKINKLSKNNKSIGNSNTYSFNDDKTYLIPDTHALGVFIDPYGKYSNDDIVSNARFTDYAKLVNNPINVQGDIESRGASGSDNMNLIALEMYVYSINCNIRSSNSSLTDVSVMPNENILCSSNGKVYLQQEIFGLKSSSEGSTVTISAPEECVVCLTDPQQVLLIPCRFKFIYIIFM